MFSTIFIKTSTLQACIVAYALFKQLQLSDFCITNATLYCMITLRLIRSNFSVFTQPTRTITLRVGEKQRQYFIRLETENTTKQIIHQN